MQQHYTKVCENHIKLTNFLKKYVTKCDTRKTERWAIYVKLNYQTLFLEDKPRPKYFSGEAWEKLSKRNKTYFT